MLLWTRMILAEGLEIYFEGRTNRIGYWIECGDYERKRGFKFDSNIFDLRGLGCNSQSRRIPEEDQIWGKN